MSARIGRPTPRIEGRAKVTGAARFAAERSLPGLHHAAIVPSKVAAGQITVLDTAAALALPGVLAVLDHRNAPRLAPVKIFPFGPAGEGWMPLQGDRVAYAGQAVALVVARTPEIATHAASLVRVAYAAEPPRTMTALLDAGEAGDELPEPLRRIADATRGDVAHGLAEADVVVEGTWDTPSHIHNALELAATVAERDAGTGTLLLHDSTQWVLGARRTVADALGLELGKVRVLCPYTGGGFGSKCFTWAHTILAAAAAWHLNVPVRLVQPRAQTHTSFGNRPQARQTLTLGARSDGTLTAIRHHAVEQTSVMDSFIRPAGEVSEVLYATPNLETRHRMLRVHSSTPTNMRAPAESFGSFALEGVMDELAWKLGMDPLALRRRNLPAAHPDGLPWSSCRLGACYDAGATAFGWDQRPLSPGTLRDGDTLIGWGMAAGCYGSYRSQAAVRVMLHADGTAEVASATHEIGSGTATLMAMVAAEELGLEVGRVAVLLGDTDLPAAPVHGASRTAATIGPAVQAAARALRQQVLALASPGRNAAEPLADVLRKAGIAQMTSEERAGPPELDDKAFATMASGINTIRQPKTKTAAMYAFCAHFVEVRVRPARGEVRVSRIVSRLAAGRILNPMGARSQALGSIVFGLGMALHEAVVWDPALGRQVSASPTDYHIAGGPDVPEALDLGFVEEQDTLVNGLGAKGVAELGLVGFAAAVANGVWHATGLRVRALPVTPALLLAEQGTGWDGKARRHGQPFGS